MVRESWLNHFLRCFGDKGDVEDITEGSYFGPRTRFCKSLAYADMLLLVIADIISTVEFDHTGNYLATGDKGGRVVLFERNETVSGSSVGHTRRDSTLRLYKTAVLTQSRRRPANINSIPSFSPMNLNSTT